MTKHERKRRAKALCELAGTLEDAYHDGWVTEDEFRAARTVPKLMALAAKLQLRRMSLDERSMGSKLLEALRVRPHYEDPRARPLDAREHRVLEQAMAWED